MKFRTALLTTLFIFGLAACSLAEDVTPPAEYIVPTVNPTKTPIPPTTSSEASVTGTSISPVATSASVTPEPGTTTEADSSTPETTGTPGAQTGSVSGMIISGSGGTLAANLIVTLRGFDMPVDQTSNPTESVHQDGTVKTDGSYTFENIEIVSGRIFLVDVTQNGIPFQSDFVVADQASLVLPVLTRMPMLAT